jgi:hypothetical protein
MCENYTITLARTICCAFVYAYHHYSAQKHEAS